MPVVNFSIAVILIKTVDGGEGMEDRMTLAEAFSALAGYGPALWCGVAAAIATFVIEVILCKKGILFGGADKKLRWQSKGTYVDRYEDKLAISR